MILAIIVGAIGATTATSPWRFAVLSDSHSNNDFDVAAHTLQFLAIDIKNQGVDLVIFPGDLIVGSDTIRSYEEQLDSWNAIMKPLYDAGIPIYVIRGNHDAEAIADAYWDLWPYEFENYEAEEFWPDEFGNYEAESTMSANSDLWLYEFPVLKGLPSHDGGFTYSFIHKNAKFLGFDQFIDPQGRMMNSWVTAQINDSTSPLNFAFGHVPLFPHSYVHRGYRSMSDDPNSRDALISALSTHNGTYFAGHEHLYLRATVSDGRGHRVPELIVGTAGRNNYDYAPIGSNFKVPNSNADKVYSNSTNPYLGYLLVTVYDNNTWTGEFKGFQHTPDIWTTRFPAIQTVDYFCILPSTTSPKRPRWSS